MEWTNDVFDSDLKLEGIIKTGESISALISQPWAFPLDHKNPHPTDEEIDEFMADMEFEVVPGCPQEWFRPFDQIHVCDGRPDNFIKSRAGVIPIDLIVSKNPGFTLAAS